MMNDEYIYMQELLNDGQSVYLHYNDMLGLYVAYGLSAYYADMCSTPEVSYSDSMQMPVALLNRHCVFDLKCLMLQVSHTPQVDYHFHAREMIGKLGYDRWAQRINIQSRKL